MQHGAIWANRSDPRLAPLSRITGKKQKVLKGHTGPVWSVSLTPDEKTIVSGSGDKTIRLWMLSTGVCLYA